MDETLISLCLYRSEKILIEKGSILLDPNRKNSYLFVILSGCFGVYLDAKDRQCLVKLHVGECVGEISVVDQESPSAYVIAEENSQVLAIASELLWSMLMRSRSLTRNLFCVLSSRVRRNNTLINDHERNSYVDVLTGLYNRRWLDEAFKREQRRISDDGNRFLSLIMADVDYFKRFNDRYGHLNGDKALEVVARSLRDCVRPRDVVARFGGEEFIIMLPDTCLETAVVIAERIRKKIHHTPITVNAMENPVTITVSLGVARMLPTDSLDELVTRADFALYEAKHNGRDQVSFLPHIQW